MTQAASNHVEPIIKRAQNHPDLRICFKSTRAVSTIQKMADGKYKVVKLYDSEVTECAKYSEAKQEASSAAMMSENDKVNVASDLVICYHSSRAVSTIQRMPDGKYQVVKLYDGVVSQYADYNEARKEASEAAFTQAPRTKKDAA